MNHRSTPIVVGRLVAYAAITTGILALPLAGGTIIVGVWYDQPMAAVSGGVYLCIASYLLWWARNRLRILRAMSDAQAPRFPA